MTNKKDIHPGDLIINRSRDDVVLWKYFSNTMLDELDDDVFAGYLNPGSFVISLGSTDCGIKVLFNGAIRYIDTKYHNNDLEVIKP